MVDHFETLNSRANLRHRNPWRFTTHRNSRRFASSTLYFSLVCIKKGECRKRRSQSKDKQMDENAQECDQECVLDTLSVEGRYPLSFRMLVLLDKR